jgi:hypothetical protein
VLLGRVEVLAHALLALRLAPARVRRVRRRA